LNCNVKKNHILDLVCVVPILCCDLGSVSARPSSHDSHFAILFFVSIWISLVSIFILVPLIFRSPLPVLTGVELLVSCR
jgi:hypothetical protein